MLSELELRKIALAAAREVGIREPSTNTLLRFAQAILRETKAIEETKGA